MLLSLQIFQKHLTHSGQSETVVLEKLEIDQSVRQLIRLVPYNTHPKIEEEVKIVQS